MAMRICVVLALALVLGCPDDGTEIVDQDVPGTTSGGGADSVVAIPDDSCVNRCGGTAPAGCGCDNDCTVRGDCCADKEPFCGAFKPPVSNQPSASCKGQCGHNAPSGCSCVDGCEEQGSCCGDKVAFCGQVVPPETESASCKGICGLQAESGCWCNNDCHQAGNCCQDKKDFCGDFKPPPAEIGDSCEGICGQQAENGCWCNNDCHPDQNCCQDKVVFCGEYNPPPAEPSASCEGTCGGEAETGCMCDNDCHENGNCCEDKVLFCGEFNPPVIAQCKDNCGGESPDGCWCNNECHANDNCCQDKIMFCGPFVPPVEPVDDSCLGLCGQSAPSGCGCSNDCHEANNCCGDKELHCGEFEPPVEPNSSCVGICGQQAQSGCGCSGECHDAGNCCTDKETACGVAPNSCTGRCGEDAPAGCSCTDGCETEGTCCPDKTDACGSPPEEVEGSCDAICGEQAPQGCWCDDLCAVNEDCCTDKEDTCGSGTAPVDGSCVGICGEQAPEGCWCDSSCETSGDCCGDKTAECGAPPVDTTTCAGLCGQQAPSGCWCDESCDASGDCCQDKDAQCGVTTCESLGHGEGACFGLFGGTECKGGGAYTCTTLDQVDLSCWVLTESCNTTQICVDPLGPADAHCEADPDNAANSCSGLCEGQAPGGCWCDSQCEGSGDCCPDKADQCGETNCADLGHTQGTCSGILNGSQCVENQPYSCETVGALKCWVQADVCNEAELCEDPLGPVGAHCEADAGNELNSCVDKCDGQAPSGCWCDVTCEQNGDCCPDKDAACGVTSCEDLGFDLGECGLFSGSKCEEGQPYSCQDAGDLSCWIQSDICGDGELCTDPFGPSPASCEVDEENPINSCAGACGNQAPGGCWCDDQCDQTGDCCPDKANECGAASCSDLGHTAGDCGVFSTPTQCQDNNTYECQDLGELSCWVLTEECAEGFQCVDPLIGGAACEVDDGSPINSCAGNCGAQAPGGCWCDAQCEATGDCCADKGDQCGATSCADLGFTGGSCGLLDGSKCEGNNPWECVDQGPVSCWVQTATCSESELCVDPLLGGAECQTDDNNAANSCAGVCGAQAPGGCWCDDNCQGTGDCCADKDTECGETTCESLGHTLGGCGLFSGSKCEVNQPYECTEIGDLDCWVQTETCEVGQTCEDPFGPTGAHCEGEATGNPDSCEGNCGDEAPGGCWCDSECVANGDCCADVAEFCP